jgi:electron transfer flavoprotein alpha subunit
MTLEQSPITTIVIDDGQDHRLSPSTLEGVAFAEKISEATDGEILVLAMGRNAKKRAETIAAQTGCNCMTCDGPGYSPYDSKMAINLIQGAAAGLKPKWIVFSGRTQGSQWAPALAGKLGTDCVTNIFGFETADDGTIFHSHIHGGKYYRGIKPLRFPVILTAQPGAFPWTSPKQQEPGRVLRMDFPTVETNIISAETIEGQAPDSRLKEASTIVAAGRGVDWEAGKGILERLAQLFSGSAIGASRPVCDIGLIPYSKQIGQTGATVSPDLYIACGISGAQQHIMGMRESKFVVSINIDPNAAIFNHSDLCVVEDLHMFLNEFIELVENDR